jgi:hypothetical protein
MIDAIYIYIYMLDCMECVYALFYRVKPLWIVQSYITTRTCLHYYRRLGIRECIYKRTVKEEKKKKKRRKKKKEEDEEACSYSPRCRLILDPPPTPYVLWGACCWGGLTNRFHNMFHFEIDSLIDTYTYILKTLSREGPWICLTSSTSAFFETLCSLISVLCCCCCC